MSHVIFLGTIGTMRLAQTVAPLSYGEINIGETLEESGASQTVMGKR